MKKVILKKLLSCFIIATFLLQTFSVYGQLGPINTPLVNFNPATLRYLSVNSANPYNYFNFLMDLGDNSSLRGQSPKQSQNAIASPSARNDNLSAEAKKLINYFFLGITLPSNVLWVNLKPEEAGRITSDELSKTDLGRTLLEQNLQLKRDMAKLLHPQNPKGKEFWEKLYSEAEKLLGKGKLKKTAINTSNRVWIVPDEAVVMETEDGALVAKATLKVMLENDYLKGLPPQRVTGHFPSGLKQTNSMESVPFSKGAAPEEETLQSLAENIMKEIIIPQITKEVNEGTNYTPLRQAYCSLILAEWFKKKYRQQGLSLYVKAIDKSFTKGLESELPWSKQQIWQDYLVSYRQGEYKLQDTIFGLKRMYFSGGVDFASSSSSIATHLQEIPFDPYIKNSPYDFLVEGLPIVNSNGAAGDEGKIPAGNLKVILPESFKEEAPISPESLPALQGQSQRGASSDEISSGSPAQNKSFSSAMEERENGIISPFGDGKIILPWKELLGPSGRSLKEEIAEKERLIPPSHEQVSSLAKSESTSFLEIDGMSEDTLKSAYEFISERINSFISSQTDLFSLLVSYLLKNGFSESRRKQLEDILIKHKEIDSSNKELFESAVEKLEYLLHPDIFELILSDSRREEIVDFFSDIWKLSEQRNVISLHRRLILLINLLEKGYNGQVRVKVKALIRRFKASIFGEEDILRIKHTMVKNRECPLDFFADPANFVPLWEKDDRAILEKVTPLLKNLKALSQEEWRHLLREVSKIGSPAFYEGKVNKITSFPEWRKFGIEIEYDNSEAKIPNAGGYENNESAWQEAKSKLIALQHNVRQRYKHVHYHIDRKDLTLESGRALMRFIVAYEGIMRLLGPFRLLGASGADAPDIDYFFNRELITEHGVYINYTDKPTIEFRFFDLPVYRTGDLSAPDYYGEYAVFDLDRLQCQVSVAMQAVEAAIKRPQDFTILNMGLPVVLGMDSRFISEQHIARMIDNLYSDNLEGKVAFLKLLSLSVAANGEMRFRKIDNEGWLKDDAKAKKAFHNNGLSYLYELHSEKERWDSNILETLKGKVAELQGENESREKNELSRFLTLLYFITDSPEERTFAEKALISLQKELLLTQAITLIKGLETESQKNNLTRYALPAFFEASANRSDEVLIAALKDLVKNQGSSPLTAASSARQENQPLNPEVKRLISLLGSGSEKENYSALKEISQGDVLKDISQADAESLFTPVSHLLESEYSFVLSLLEEDSETIKALVDNLSDYEDFDNPGHYDPAINLVDGDESMAFVLRYPDFVKKAGKPLFQVILKNTLPYILEDNLEPNKSVQLDSRLLEEYRSHEAMFALERLSIPTVNSKFYINKVIAYQQRGYYDNEPAHEKLKVLQKEGIINLSAENEGGISGSPLQQFTPSAIDTNIKKEEAIQGGSARVGARGFNGAPSPLNTAIQPVADSSLEPGGIDLSKIELTLKDEKFVSSLNPADLKILRAGRALNQGWNSLSILYLHEIMLLLKDDIVSDIQNKALLQGILNQIKLKNLFDPQLSNFLRLLQLDQPMADIKLALIK